MVEKKLKLIKSAYTIGAIADAFWTIALLCPSIYGALIGRPDFEPDLSVRMTMGIAASLMAGWTVLLLWARQSPVERRGVLLITVFPVVAGIAVTTVAGIIYLASSSYWILAKISFLAIIMLTAYHFATNLFKETKHEVD